MITTKKAARAKSTSYRSCLLLASTGVVVAAMGLAQPARADDYTDLLDILRAKGSLTQTEYSTLMAKHRHPNRAQRRANRAESEEAATEAPDNTAALAQAQQAAASAAASAAQAQAAATQTQVALKDPMIVRTDTYVPGKGVTFHAGPIDVNLSGFINGFYTYNSPDRNGQVVAGGLSTGGANGFDSSSVRNGLLPGAVILKLSTTQNGIDLAAVFGAYPGLDNATNGALNANSGGSPIGLGTAGIDLRQLFVTAGTKEFGTIKVGRDIGLFGADAILNDATLLSVGSSGSNAAPGNTSLGRIGIGYVYTDWLPQITYTTPNMGGATASIGVMQPLDEFDFSGYSASSTQHSTPMFQGQISFKWGTGPDMKGHIWADGLVQPHDQVYGFSGETENGPRTVTAYAGDVGGTLALGPVAGAAYYYRGSGLGSTGLFFDGIAFNGAKRDSEGYYLQGSYNIVPKLKLVGSYGVSDLYQASGEADPDLVRRNESYIGAGYYTLTDWMTLVAEYAHTESKSHGPSATDDNTVSLGTIVFF
jgi:predicted porin